MEFIEITVILTQTTMFCYEKGPVHVFPPPLYYMYLISPASFPVLFQPISSFLVPSVFPLITLTRVSRPLSTCI